MLLRLFVAALVLLAPIEAQKAEPRVRIEGDPSSIAADLTSSGPRQRQALQRLDVEPVRSVTGVKLQFLQLDDDPELEAILTLEISSDQFLLIYDNDSKGWWQVGNLWMAHALSGLPDLELKSLFGSVSKEILLRRHARKGSGVSAVHLSIYQLHRGQLYEIFQIEEAADNFCTLDTNIVTFPQTREVNSFLVLRSTSGPAPGAPPICGKPIPTKRSCTVYRWDETKPAFVVEKSPAVRHLCSAK